MFKGLIFGGILFPITSGEEYCQDLMRSCDVGLEGVMQLPSSPDSESPYIKVRLTNETMTVQNDKDIATFSVSGIRHPIEISSVDPRCFWIKHLIFMPGSVVACYNEDGRPELKRQYGSQAICGHKVERIVPFSGNTGSVKINIGESELATAASEQFVEDGDKQHQISKSAQEEIVLVIPIPANGPKPSIIGNAFS